MNPAEHLAASALLNPLAPGKMAASDMTRRSIWDQIRVLAVILAVASAVANMSFTADADGFIRFWRVAVFTNPYAALCADVGAPTKSDWGQYATSEPEPRICSSASG